MQIPKINEPYNLWEKFVKSMEQLRNPRKPSTAQSEDITASEALMSKEKETGGADMLS